MTIHKLETDVFYSFKEVRQLRLSGMFIDVEDTIPVHRIKKLWTREQVVDYLINAPDLRRAHFYKDGDLYLISSKSESTHLSCVLQGIKSVFGYPFTLTLATMFGKQKEITWPKGLWDGCLGGNDD